MPFLRKTIFYLFVAIYLAICPMLILRLLGFVFDPLNKHWVKTGIIYVSSNPPDANVYINGRLAPEKSPTVIRDLTPGNYLVRMELKDYKPWENTVPVIDKKATSIENILLMPIIWDAKAISPLPMTDILGLPASNSILMIKENNVKDISILRINDNDQIDFLFPPESIYRDGQLINTYSFNQSPFIVLHVKLSDKEKYLWVDTREKPIHIEDISELINVPVQWLWWEPNDDKNIYVTCADGYNRINIKAKAIYPNIDPKTIPEEKKKPVIKDTPSGSQVYAINNNNTFLIRSNDGIFLQDHLPKDQARITKILTVAAGTNIFFNEKNGKLYYIDSRKKMLMSTTILRHKPFIPKPIAETLRLKKLEE